MAMLRLAASHETPLIFDRALGRQAPRLTVAKARAAAPGLRRNQPLTVLVHGYKFDPFGGTDPHEYLFHFNGLPHDRLGRSVSWPLGLGFREADRNGETGLAVAFAWQSRPAVRFGRFCAAYGEAGRAALALARTLELLVEAFPGREIDVVAHSLGARVALGALGALGQARRPALQRVGRVLLLAPAEMVGAAREAMYWVDVASSTRKPLIYNVMARENDVFDVMAERFAPRGPGVRPICLGATGLGRDREDWLDIQLDSPELLDWLRPRGVEIGGGARRACHWGVYNRPGALDLYARILRDRSNWSIAALRAAGMPMSVEPRWSRWPRLRPWAAPQGREAAT